MAFVKYCCFVHVALVYAFPRFKKLALFDYFINFVPQVDAVVQGGDETPEESDDSTGFEILAPDPSRICRVVRGRRYRPVRTFSKCAKPFSGETISYEIHMDDETNTLTSDTTISLAVVLDVTISGPSIATSFARHNGYLKREIGGRGSPFLCHRDFAPRGMGLGSIRGGATPAEEGEDTDKENVAPLSVEVSIGIDTIIIVVETSGVDWSTIIMTI